MYVVYKRAQISLFHFLCFLGGKQAAGVRICRYLASRQRTEDLDVTAAKDSHLVPIAFLAKTVTCCDIRVCCDVCDNDTLREFIFFAF